MPVVNTSVLLGETIREVRLERQMTQQALADRCKMERTFIIAVEKGRKNPSARTLIHFAAALKILPSELFRRFSKKIMKAVADEQRTD
jgi:transcriptional regulator with XRE-family HTH domain